MPDNSLPTHLDDLIARRLGLSVHGPRQNALMPALQKLAVMTADEPGTFVDTLQAMPFTSAAWQVVIDALTIGETRFLRQPSWFERIERVILAPIIAKRMATGRKRLRIWCAGCSTGEEPYTVAMLLHDMIPDPEEWDIGVLATDIRSGAILAAGKGEYAANQLREIDDRRRARFFQPSGRARYAVVPALRDMVRFDVGNLADLKAGHHHYDGGPYDLIICRNVLMYMVPDVQRSVAARLGEALSEDGWIAVSPAEAMADWFKPLVPLNSGEAILFSRQSAAAPRAKSPGLKPLEQLPLPRQDPQARRKREPQDAAARPASIPAGLESIRSMADAGRLREAETLCRQAIKADGLNGEASILLSAILTELGDVGAAHEAARYAVYLMPSSAPALNLLAGTLLKLGHTERARRTFAAARRLAEGSRDDDWREEMTTPSGAAGREVDRADGR